jgi:hypothetical protein
MCDDVPMSPTSIVASLFSFLVMQLCLYSSGFISLSQIYVLILYSGKEEFVISNLACISCALFESVSEKNECGLLGCEALICYYFEHVAFPLVSDAPRASGNTTAEGSMITLITVGPFLTIAS